MESAADSHQRLAKKLVFYGNQFLHHPREADSRVSSSVISESNTLIIDKPIKQRPVAESQVSRDSNSAKSVESPISEIHASRNILGYGKTLTPRPHQEQALRAIFETFTKLAEAGKDMRTRVTLPCGTGKSLLGYWTRQKVLEDKRREHDVSPAPSLVLVPSLDLVMQIKNDWLKQDPSIKYLCVCSDPEVDIQKSEKGGKKNKPNQTTKSEEIAQFLQANPNGVIFSTYQSFDKIKAAEASIPDFKFALTIFDEAHETAGPVEKERSRALYNVNHKTERRVFFTATPRISTTTMNSADPVKTLVSMDDETIFGPEAFKMSYREAVDAGIIVPYKIIGVRVNNEDPELLQKIKKFQSEHPESFDLQHHFFAQALQKARQDFPRITHTLIVAVFRPIADALQRTYQSLYPKEFSTFLDAKLPAETRKNVLDYAKKVSKAVIMLAKSGRTGLNIPKFNSIMFTSPGASLVQTVQSIGRILRKDPEDPEKTCAYVIVPMLPDDNQSLLDILNLMSQYDTQLASEIKAYVKGDVPAEVLERHIQILNLEKPLIETEKLYTQVLKNTVPIRELQGLHTFEDIQRLVKDQFGPQSPKIEDFIRDAYKRTGFGPDAIGKLLTRVEPTLKAIQLTDRDVLDLIYGKISVDQLIIRKAMPSPSNLEELSSLVRNGYKSPDGLEIYSGFGTQKPSLEEFRANAYVKTGYSVKTLTQLVQSFEPKLQGVNIEARDLLKLIYCELTLENLWTQYSNKGAILNLVDFKAFQEIFKEGYIDPDTRKKICPGFGTKKPTLHEYTRQSERNIQMTPAKIENLIRELIPELASIKLNKIECIDLLYGGRSADDILRSRKEVEELPKPQNFQDLQDLIKSRYGDKLPEATIFEETSENTVGLTINECQGLLKSHFELAPESRLTVKKMLETIYFGTFVKSSIVPKVVEPKHRIDSSSINDIYDLQARFMYGDDKFPGFGKQRPHPAFFRNYSMDKVGLSETKFKELITKILTPMIRNIPYGEDWLNANTYELLGFVYADNPRMHLTTNLPTAHIIKNMPKETIQDIRNLFINGLTTEKGRKILPGFGDKEPYVVKFQNEAEQKIGMDHPKFQALFKTNIFPKLIESEPNTHASWLSPKEVQTKHLIPLIYSDDYRSLLREHRDKAIIAKPMK